MNNTLNSTNKHREVKSHKKLKMWFLNNLFNKEYCTHCGCNLKDIKIDGFDELEHYGTGQRKWYPDCGKPFFV
jgi:hypothetical protein